MYYSLQFEITGLPSMANLQSGKSHWRHAHNEAMKWQKLVGVSVMGKKPKNVLKKANLVLVRYSSTEPDYDGLVRGFKSVVDGLVKFGIIENDKLSNTGVWDCRWIKCQPKLGKISVTVLGECFI